MTASAGRPGPCPIAALEDKARTQRGTTALTGPRVELFCKLKREVPERSLDRLIRIAEELGRGADRLPWAVDTPFER